MIRRFLLALQFLTIFPVTIRGEVTEKQIAELAAFFPLVGLLQGSCSALPPPFLRGCSPQA